jgi:2'-5' RNA ligase
MSNSIDRLVEAALDVHIPEVEPLVASFRDQYDPSAAKGMPVHITINYPFIPGVSPNENLYQGLAELFSKIDAFTFTFNQFGRFPDVIYLEPEQNAPFKELIEKVADRFPESPPYGGAFDRVVPHLTIAHATDEKLLSSIEHQLKELAPLYLPMMIQVERVWLMDNRSGSWQEQKSFLLVQS